MKAFKLENEPKIKPGFKTPDGYHDSFSLNFLQNLPKEEITKKVTVISIFRKRKNTILSIAAVFVLALMIPILYITETKNNELDSTTIENYLTEESNITQYDLISEIEPEINNVASSKKQEDQTLEDILVANPNIENLVIENQSPNTK